MIAVKFMMTICEYCGRAQGQSARNHEWMFFNIKKSKTPEPFQSYNEENELKIHPVWRVVTEIMHKVNKPSDVAYPTTARIPEYLLVRGKHRAMHGIGPSIKSIENRIYIGHLFVRFRPN